MYCGAEIHRPEAESAGKSAAPEQDLAAGMDPSLLSSLPAALRDRFTAPPQDPRKAAAPPAPAKAAPAMPASTPAGVDLPEDNADRPVMDPSMLAALPSGLRDRFTTESSTTSAADAGDLSGSTSATDLPEPSFVPTGATEVPEPSFARPPMAPSVKESDPYDLPEPTSIEEPDSEDPDTVNTDQYIPVETASPPTPLLKGGGVWGPRNSLARILLLPDPSYKKRVPWLRARLSAQLGLDAYSCNMYLQRDFPVFLAGYDSENEAQQMAENLIDGGMRILVLTRSMVADQPPAFLATAAQLEGDSIRFVSADRTSRVLPRDKIEQAIFAEIKPPASPIQPLVERNFWGTKGREGKRMDEVLSPYWAVEFVVSPPGAPIRARADMFDFSCLGNRRVPSSLINLRALPAHFAPQGQTIPADDLFKRVPRAQGADARVQPVEGEEYWTPEELLFAEYTLLQGLSRQVPAAKRPTATS